jgi:hypothetical protein
VSRDTPGAKELFMGMWHNACYNTRNPALEVTRWAKVWVDCCVLAGRIAEMESAASAAEQADNPSEEVADAAEE